jgi:iron complex transport system ATP-binding protein
MSAANASPTGRSHKMMTTAALRTVDLAVGYKSRGSEYVVLDELNLSVRPGELVCLLGINGAGKSTLLKTISRIQPPLSGNVELTGVNLRDLSQIDLARRLGVVLTERPLVGALTARRVVELGRYPYLNWAGKMEARDHKVVDWAINAVSASHLESRDSSSLSDGERQRFMIARALAQEPSLLLLDEPTAFLDVPSRVELMGLLRRLAREENLAIVISTHDLELALRMADTLWLVAERRRLHTGTPEDMILAGSIANTFQGENIRFHPEERAFRMVTGARGRAVVDGQGLHAILAAAVLEREGYEVVADAPDALKITIVPGGTQWQVDVEGSRNHGEGFEALAVFVRSIGSLGLR